MGKRLLLVNVILGVALVAIRLFFWPAEPERLPVGLVAVDGRIDGQHTMVVTPQTGRVKRLPIAVGDCLVKGQVVAELEDDTLLDRDRQVRRDLEQARARVRFLATELDALARESGTGQGLAAKQESLARAKAQEAKAQTVVDQTETALLARLVTSPVNGVVVGVSSAAGDAVVAGSPLASLVDLDTLHFTGHLSETQAAHLRVGLPGDIRPADMPQRPFPAIVTGLTKGQDRPDTVHVTLTFSGELLRCLLPGQTASALILSQDEVAQASGR